MSAPSEVDFVAAQLIALAFPGLCDVRMAKNRRGGSWRAVKERKMSSALIAGGEGRGEGTYVAHACHLSKASVRCLDTY